MKTCEVLDLTKNGKVVYSLKPSCAGSESSVRKE